MLKQSYHAFRMNINENKNIFKIFFVLWLVSWYVCYGSRLFCYFRFYSTANVSRSFLCVYSVNRFVNGITMTKLPNWTLQTEEQCIAVASSYMAFSIVKNPFCMLRTTLIIIHTLILATTNLLAVQFFIVSLSSSLENTLIHTPPPQSYCIASACLPLTIIYMFWDFKWFDNNKLHWHWLPCFLCAFTSRVWVTEGEYLEITFTYSVSAFACAIFSKTEWSWNPDPNDKVHYWTKMFVTWPPNMWISSLVFVCYRLIHLNDLFSMTMSNAAQRVSILLPSTFLTRVSKREMIQLSAISNSFVIEFVFGLEHEGTHMNSFFQLCSLNVRDL